jgi:FAD/FMN-containing dehydrogenase
MWSNWAGDQRCEPAALERPSRVGVEGGEELLAARVALGALGVVTEVTLQTVPAFTLRRLDAPVTLAEVLDGLDERVETNRHFEFFAFPHADIKARAVGV